MMDDLKNTSLNALHRLLSADWYNARLRAHRQLLLSRLLFRLLVVKIVLIQTDELANVAIDPVRHDFDFSRHNNSTEILSDSIKSIKRSDKAGDPIWTQDHNGAQVWRDFVPNMS